MPNNHTLSIKDFSWTTLLLVCVKIRLMFFSFDLTSWNDFSIKRQFYSILIL